MTITQLVHRLARRAKGGGDFTKLGLTEQMDVLEAANSALQQVYNILPIYFKEMTVGFTLPAPVALTNVGVTNGSQNITGLSLTADQIGRTIILDGDDSINQIIVANTPSPAPSPTGQSFDSGLVTLLNGAASAVVSFNQGFSGVPAIQTQILLPDGTSAGIFCWPDYSTLTANSVTVQFGAATPASGYILSWIATGKPLTTSQVTQAPGTNMLMTAYNGPTGTVNGTIYGDSIYSTRLPFDRIIGNPDFSDQTSWPMLPRTMMRNDFPFLGMIPSVGRPQFWWVQPLGNSQGQSPLLVLRFWPMPDQVYPVKVRMGFWPLRLALADLDLAVTIPVPDQFIDAALVPIGLRALMISPIYENHADDKTVLDAAARGDAFLANQPGQVGSPQNRIFTPVGF